MGLSSVSGARVRWQGVRGLDNPKQAFDYWNKGFRPLKPVEQAMLQQKPTCRKDTLNEPSTEEANKTNQVCCCLPLLCQVCLF
jgi:hypothetical protein